MEFTNGDGIIEDLPEIITDGSGNVYDVIIYALPAYWATYLINGDDSGLEPEEVKEIKAWLATENHPYFVDVGASRFSRSNDATSLGGDVCEYVAHIKQA